MFASLFALVAPAFACGGFFPPPESFAASNTQEAIFTPGDGSVTVQYRVLVSRDADDFGWIVPIPGEFEELTTGDLQRFEELRDMTDPIHDLETDEGGGIGCGAASKSLGMDGAGEFDTGANDVDVIAEGFAGPYDYVVLEAGSAEALTLWLSQHGYDVGPSGPSLEAYVADGNFQFVALSLQPDNSTELIEAPPISVRYAGDRIVYPARMSRYSLAGRQHTVVYVEGDQRARLAEGWVGTDLPLVWDDGESADYMVAEAFPEALADIGQDRGYAVVFAGNLAGRFVTRFETYADPEVHTADATFTVDAGTDELHTVISNKGGCEAPEGAAALLLPVALLGAWRRRR